MIFTLFGIVLFAAPLLLLRKFKDKRYGFAAIVSLMIAGHWLIAAASQALHIFHYAVITIIHTGIAVALIAGFKKPEGSWREWRKRIDWVAIVVLAIACMHLFRVHYSYTGKIADIRSHLTRQDSREVTSMRYPWPYFADEWCAIAFVKHSIEHHSLPLKNPFIPRRSRFPNFEAAFHSLLAEIMLLMQLDPVTDYTKITLVVGMLICLLLYLLLVHCGIHRLVAAIAALCALYITNGANLPGIWTLLPLIMGLVAMLSGMFFFVNNSVPMMLFATATTLLLYPPLVVFWAPGYIAGVLVAPEVSWKTRLKNVALLVLLIGGSAAIVALFYLLAQGKKAPPLIDMVISKVLYTTPIEGAIPDYSLWHIVPIPVLALSLVGLYALIKKKVMWCVVMALVGIGYCIAYSFTTFRVVIEYERVAVVTALLLVVCAGFGLEFLLKKLGTVAAFRNKILINSALAGVLMILSGLSFRYTERENWSRLVLREIGSNRIMVPASPANAYLHADDLRLFEHIQGKYFLSHPWKGSVIAVATGNYPVSCKPGTITVNPDLFREFMMAGCAEKHEIAKKWSIDYVYAPAIQ
ncbi:MAG: hypothetical protein GF350_02695, partial [Chitinivibrionales bacterium]|nr:hypothetical protein [Chitinivibrionales bacterium]